MESPGWCTDETNEPATARQREREETRKAKRERESEKIRRAKLRKRDENGKAEKQQGREAAGGFRATIKGFPLRENEPRAYGERKRARENEREQ